MFVPDICRIFGTNLKNICKNMGQILGILWRKSEKKLATNLKRSRYIFFSDLGQKIPNIFRKKRKICRKYFSDLWQKIRQIFGTKRIFFLYIIENFCECRAVSPTAMLAELPCLWRYGDHDAGLGSSIQSTSLNSGKFRIMWEQLQFSKLSTTQSIISISLPLHQFLRT